MSKKAEIVDLDVVRGVNAVLTLVKEIERLYALNAEMLDALKNAQVIIESGDYTTVGMAQLLRRVKTVLAIAEAERY